MHQSKNSAASSHTFRHHAHKLYGFVREYSPRKTVFQLRPLSLDFSHVCSTLSAASLTTFTRFNAFSSVGPLRPSNSAAPPDTFPLVKTCTRPSLSANIPYQLLSSSL